jgi:hypothetical protein
MRLYQRFSVFRVFSFSLLNTLNASRRVCRAFGAPAGDHVMVANYSPEPRNELIRRLRAQGWSLRRIAADPRVRLSVGGVHAIVNADDKPADEAEVAERRRVGAAARR